MSVGDIRIYRGAVTDYWGWEVSMDNLYAARAMFLQFGRKPWRADRGSCE